ncbi:MAG: hypothetical protein ACT4OF_14110 [Caulobacteraceae bacterium]
MADKNTTPSKPAPGGKKPGGQAPPPGQVGQRARPLDPSNPGKEKK